MGLGKLRSQKHSTWKIHDNKVADDGSVNGWVGKGEETTKGISIVDNEGSLWPLVRFRLQTLETMMILMNQLTEKEIVWCYLSSGINIGDGVAYI